MSCIDIITIKEDIKTVLSELLDCAKLSEGSLVVLGCSSSEITGQRIGTCSSMEAAEAVYDVILPELAKRGIYLAAQCCEHLNRALVIERKAAKLFGYEIVNAIPHAHAGGASATTAYSRFEDAVVVENVRADAGIDIGGTLIGMHLKPTAVPVKLSKRTIGEAVVLAARTRPKFIGGERAIYNNELL
ncbi:MAG: TIGR01440 family protein [Ruminococcaceae bacterium]|nr:TIGR01440 family protein [Oscillospiraceae bacterium]